MDRIVKAHSPLGEEVLRFHALRGTEALSQLFEFEVELLADSHSIDLKSLLGQALTLEVQTVGAAPRYLDGIVARGMLLGREGLTDREYRYRLIVRPWLWLLTQTRDCKIFQTQTVPQILQAVLGEYGFPIETRLTGSYRSWNYCVQYQETDFDFVSRLMEHEGIYYYFKHSLGSHTLVLTDDMGSHATLPNYASIPFFKAERTASVLEEYVDRYHVAEEIAPGAYVTDDYNFTKPRAKLQNQRANPGAHQHGDMEIYDWMGGYGELGDSDHYSRIRLEGLQAERERDEGHASVRGMAPGYRFTLRSCPRDDANREYLLVSVSYDFQEPGYASDPTLARYECEFVTQPTSLPFRPRRVTPKPRTNGPQTATVVGPAGEVIWTDEYGRIKVQFRWDRYGNMDENSSCWLRVASSWAGSNFGAMYIPRIGQEVVVDFIGGEADRPIVIGCTYNADQMPAYGLPASASKSGFVSRTIKGSQDNANKIIFEDAHGGEEFNIQAEKDYYAHVKNNKSNKIDANFTERIGGDAAHRVEGNKQTAILKSYRHSVTGNSDRTVTGPSTETHQNTYDHATIGPSTVTRGAPHRQTYAATYSHKVLGLADSSYESDHTQVHGANFTHTVTADHRHEVQGDHRHEVKGEHRQTVGGDQVQTIVGDRTVTTANTSHHTAGVHSTVAGDFLIDTSGGGGGAQAPANDPNNNLPPSSNGQVGVTTNKFNVHTQTSVDVVSIYKVSCATTNFQFQGFSFIGRGISTALNGKTLSLFGAKTDVCLYKRDVVFNKAELFAVGKRDAAFFKSTSLLDFGQHVLKCIF